MYAELAVTTNYSFLRGASHPQELVVAACALGLAGLGIADRNSVAGVVRAHAALRELEHDPEKWERHCDPEHSEGEAIQGHNAESGLLRRPVGAPRNDGLERLKLAVGARLVFADGTPDILAYPRDRRAWARLTRLLSAGKSRAEKGECTLYLDDLIEHGDGLNLIVLPPARIRAEPLGALLERLRTSLEARSLWLAASMLYRGDDQRRLARLIEIAAAARVPPIAVNDVLYHAPERRPLQDVVTAIREHVTIDTAGRRLEANAERHLKAGDEMARLFRRAPEAVAETITFLERCRFSLDELRLTEYPDETRQGFATPQEALVSLAHDGARRRYPDGMPAEVAHALERELAITAELKYAPYFLTVHEIVRFARGKGILCQGRGSAANSVICYCLGITEVDPTRIKLLFERFVSAERREPPDIDVDFEHERREEVIQHIYQQYGRDRAGLAATVICYRGRSAIREVGKAFGLSDDTIGMLAGTLWGWSSEGVAEKEVRRAGLDPSDPRLARVLALSRELIGFPRHLSQHVGGFVVTRSRLDEVVPIENAAMEDRTVIEWDKDDLDALALLKVDVLGLGMLSCIRRSFDLMRIHYGRRDTLASLHDTDDDARADKPVYRMLSRADSVGVFQVESRAQMSMLPRLRPQTFYDLVIEVAIVRPGPIQGDMVHPYLRRREKLRETGEEPTYPAPDPAHGDKDELKEVLAKTLGVPLFQEQAMRIAIVAAKFPPAKADSLRRAMATFRRVGTIDSFRDAFVRGMTARGYALDFAQRCFQQIEGFGEYGFPESHAASFAILVYVSAWIKCHYPDVFAAALLNSQPMGFYAPAQIVRDAQEHGVEIRPVDVNRSDWDCALEELPHDGHDPRAHLHPRHADMRDDIRSTHALRLGLRQISGLPQADAERIESVRGPGFDSVRDLWLRSRLSSASLERLAAADAFGSLGLDRRDALWAVRALQRAGDKDDLPLFRRVKMPELEPDAGLPPMLPGEQVVEDYRRLRLSLKAHPVGFLRADLARRGILRHEELTTRRTGERVTVAGLVLVRQRPGNGKAIFMTLEDETGIANTILWVRTFEAYRPVVMGARLIAVTGTLQNEYGVIHVVAEHMEDLTGLLRRLSADHGCVEAMAHADAVKRPATEKPRHPRAGNTLVTLFKDDPALADALGLTATAEVMPKGRNFH
jgi:error-prone DNA polymerase